jgi:hypothetical protein
MLIPFGILASAAARALAGYFAGSSTAPGTAVYKFDFSSESTSSLANSLSTGRGQIPAGLSNSGVAGYVVGGYVSSSVASVDKYLFLNDSRTTLVATLSSAKYGIAGLSDSGVAGYAAGGDVNGSVIDKFSFSNDSRTTLGTTLSSARSYVRGASNSGVSGYIGGGLSPSPSFTVQSTVDKITFSSDSRSTLGSGLSSARLGTAAMANKAVAAYFAGGGNSSFVAQTTVDKFVFSSDTRSTLSTGLSTPGDAASGINNATVAGYVGSLGSPTTVVDKFSFPSDTRSTLSASLLTGTGGSSSFSNEGVF